MKKYAALGMILLFFSIVIFENNLQGASQVAQIDSVKGKEVIIAGSKVADKLPMGSKVYVAKGNGVIILKVDFPMQTVARCSVIKGSSKWLKKGMAVYRGDGSDVFNIDEKDSIKSNIKTIEGIELVYIKGGVFVMGEEGNTYEMPAHKRSVGAFWIGKYEITQKQYMNITGENPSKYDGGWFGNNEDYPVERVSWYEAVEFCNALSKKAGLTPAYVIDKNQIDPANKNRYNGDKRWTVSLIANASGFRLPTEAQWEYACRAGSKSVYYWGDEIDDDYCWYSGNSDDKTHPVGTKKPNAFGLYDMSGNVWEWCWDWYQLYDKKDVRGFENSPFMRDYRDRMSGGTSRRVLRGGSCIHLDKGVCSAMRYSLIPNSSYVWYNSHRLSFTPHWHSPKNRFSGNGLRVVLPVSSK
ncbi:MAG TPA: SUMF1/EgtB/PvdO family nonheme iron enzyme [Spirochaetota bacterium]|nr:SUMF1/EgtB/PvdO family nonheme iron enzyme [Spirochaetota bacterium]HPJ34022.1 SUMF1/EgtB/PvdO family nonheme iron enzyme [Spirochaetota bacterium]